MGGPNETHLPPIQRELPLTSGPPQKTTLPSDRCRRCTDWTKIRIFVFTVGAQTGPNFWELVSAWRSSFYVISDTYCPDLRDELFAFYLILDAYCLELRSDGLNSVFPFTSFGTTLAGNFVTIFERTSRFAPIVRTIVQKSARPSRAMCFSKKKSSVAHLDP